MARDIRPPSVVPAVVGYYHIPPIWVGDPPSKAEFETAPVKDLIRDVYRTSLDNGIEIRARRDGLFVFDCAKWSAGGMVDIPGYESVPGQKIPHKVSEAEHEAEAKAAARVRLLNVHQACLNAAHSEKAKRACEIGTPIRPYRVLNFANISDNQIGDLGNHDPLQNHIAQQLVFSRGYRMPRMQFRQVVESDVLEHSFQLLNWILNKDDNDTLQLVDFLYHSAIQYSEYHFAESLILSWSVCEQLLSHMWKGYLDSASNEAAVEARIGKDRLKKLTGRDFTASVIAEILELAGILPTPLYTELEKIRKARNAWLHDATEAKAGQAAIAHRRAEELFKHVVGFRFSLTLRRLINLNMIPKHLFEKYSQK